MNNPEPIDVSKLDVKLCHCPRCGSTLVVTHTILAEVRNLENIAQAPDKVPIQLLACAKCNKVFDLGMDNPFLKKVSEAAGENFGLPLNPLEEEKK